MKPILKSALLVFIVAAAVSGILVLSTGMIVGEKTRDEQERSAQWLAKDLATQFSFSSSQLLVQAQKFGNFANVDAGVFDPLAKKEFDLSTLLKAVWLVDSPGNGELAPLSRLEKRDFQLDGSAREALKQAVVEAERSNASLVQLSPELFSVVVRLGDRPRFIVLIGTDSFFARAQGGPHGEKWFLIKQLSDKLIQPLYASQPEETSGGIEFPGFSDIQRVLDTESPELKKVEISATINSATGIFYLSGVQTGVFGILAVVVSPLDTSTDFTPIIMRIALGTILTIVFATMLLSSLIQFSKKKRSRI